MGNVEVAARYVGVDGLDACKLLFIREIILNDHYTPATRPGHARYDDHDWYMLEEIVTISRRHITGNIAITRRRIKEAVSSRRDPPRRPVSRYVNTLMVICTLLNVELLSAHSKDSWDKSLGRPRFTYNCESGPMALAVMSSGSVIVNSHQTGVPRS